MADVHSYLAQIADLAQALRVLGWDQQTYMPPGGAAARAEQMASLRDHKRISSEGCYTRSRS